MASSPITSWQIDGETMETMREFILGGSKITADCDHSHEIKRCLLLGRKAITNLAAAAAAAKSLQSCPTVRPHKWQPTRLPRTLGFSRQEHWSRLPFPSPMHESEKWKSSSSVVSTLRDPMDCSPPGSSVRGIFQARVLEWVAIAFSNLPYSSINLEIYS